MGRIPLRDLAIAVGVAVLLLAGALSEDHPEPLGLALVVVGGLVLAAGRQAPIAVVAVTAASALGYQALGVDVPAVAYLFAVYVGFRAGHRAVTVAVTVAMVVALPIVLVLTQDMAGREAMSQARDVLQLAWLVAAGAAGEALRQAERRADEAERTREETARRRADEERLHIARELHDSLTHQISVIKVQAEVAVHLADKRGEPVPESLMAIREAVREAARELRATLETLREEPPHGLNQIPELVRRARSAGLNATLTIEGDCSSVPEAVDRTGYRIVQESLTNIARHAAAATATIRIDHRPGTLTIRVEDDGNATAETELVPGVGLQGMRERVTALGGSLQAEPRSEGGFAVRAELPVEHK